MLLFDYIRLSPHKCTPSKFALLVKLVHPKLVHLELVHLELVRLHNNKTIKQYSFKTFIVIYRLSFIKALNSDFTRKQTHTHTYRKHSDMIVSFLSLTLNFIFSKYYENSIKYAIGAKLNAPVFM